MPDLSQQTQDVFQQLYGAAQDYSKSLDSAKTGVNTAPMQKIIAQEGQLASQIPTQFPKAPQLNTQLPTPPEAPDIQPLETFSQVAPAMIVLGSLFARGPSTAAADSAAAAMNAYKQGKTQEYEQARDAWKDKTQQMLDQNKLELDAYDTAVKESKGNLDLLQAKMTAVASQFKDENTLAMLQAGNVEKALDLKSKKLEAWTKVNDEMVKLNKAQDQFLTEDQYQQYKNDPAMQLALRAYKITGNARSAIGGGAMGGGGKSLLPKIEALQRMAIESDPNFNPATASLKYKGFEKEMNTVSLSAGKIQLASNILDSSLPSLLESAKKVGLSDIRGINALYNSAKNQMNDADFKNFQTQMRAVATDYGQFIGRTQGTVHSDEEALNILNVGMSDKSLQGFADAVDTERANVQKGIDKTLGSIESNASGMPSGNNEAPEGTVIHNGDITMVKKDGKWVTQ